ncbi:MAG: hypothetical protein AABX47_04170 [Nanoarchaeota archaeon]
MRERRGQATVFIILGILIILAGYAIFISVQSSSGPSFEMPAVTRQSAATGEAYNVKSFIQTCVDITAKEAVDAFGMYGGEEKPSLLKPVLITGDYTIPYYAFKGTGILPANTAIAQDILSSYVNKHLPECLLNFYDFTSVTVRGARINNTPKEFDLSLLGPSPVEGNMIKTEARIGQDNVMFTVDYPVIVEKGDRNTYLTDKYTSLADARIGPMLDISRRIVNLNMDDPEVVDWPTIYDTNHAGQFNMTYILTEDNENGVTGAVIYQIIDKRPSRGQDPFLIRFAVGAGR